MKRMLLPAALALVVAAPARATAPGHNGLIAFERPTGGQVDLFAANPDGSGLHALTRTKTWEEKPEWSPDGSRLAFDRSGPRGNPTEIATSDSLGGKVKVVTNYRSTSSAPTWSPDGRLAYFSLHDFPASDTPPPAELYTIGLDGTDERRLTDDKQIQTDPEWSPDGAKIAFSAWWAVPGQPGVFDIGLSVMDPDGGQVHPVLRHRERRDIVTQDWSPDEKRFVIEVASSHPRGRDGKPGTRQSDIAVVNADGSKMRYLTRTAALESEPVWSPDGTHIAFASDRHVRRGNHLDRNGRAYEIYTMRADGTSVRRLTHNHVPDLYPTWQPLR